MPANPNFVFIFCDDLGWGDVSCLNPESKIQTPNIDRLAASGMNFTDAHTGSAVCTPSRYTLLTGRYCWRTELKSSVGGGYSPPLIMPDRLTVAGMLKQAGYRTACIGKWHVGFDWQLKDEFAGETMPRKLCREESRFDEMVDFAKPIQNGPVDVGFNYYFGISASLDMSPYVFIENDRATEIPCETVPRGQTPEARARAGIGAKGWRHEDVLPALRDKSIEFIKTEAAAGNPFFLYLPVNGPHTPVVPNPEWIGKSEAGIYGDFVMEIDDVVGKVIAALDEAGVRENTVVVFSSDNGPETLTARYRESYGHYSAWKFRGMKRDNWEGGHRVPFLVSWPAEVEAGAVCKEVVEVVDFMATAADICGIEIPETAGEDSRSILPYFRGDFAEDCRPFAIHNSIGGQWAIRRGKYKVLLHSGSGGNPYDCPENNDPVQVYDLEADPFETTNIYAEHLDVVQELRDLCLSCIQDGRSTPGQPSANDPNGEWQQLQTLLRLTVDSPA
jgi:arylsulfatase A-like enzyme